MLYATDTKENQRANALAATSTSFMASAYASIGSIGYAYSLMGGIKGELERPVGVYEPDSVDEHSRSDEFLGPPPRLAY
ncbi:hypothetical protein K449DRAFT_435900 [Hypoxylon sp. EC38]|nr:hypothetical protein K449DRAFT_435900 [Hypoxylon sp. EC38]